MIKKSLIAFGLLFLVYTVILLLKPGLTNYSQQQEQTNIMNAQQYLYNNQTYQAVIVGSSLSTRFKMASLPGYANLAFGGLSVLDGLNIIKHGTTLPRAIFIETNVLERPASETFSHQIFDPIPFYTKKYIIALQDAKKPMGFAELVIEVAVEKLWPNFFKSQPVVVKSSWQLFPLIPVAYAQTTDTVVTPAMGSPVLDVQSQNYAQAPSMDVLNANLAALKDYVDYFTAQGVQVYFFETSIRADLAQAPKSVVEREVLQQYFPDSLYKKIPPLDNIYGDQGDGIHLSDGPAQIYTDYFKAQADALLQAN